MNYIFNQTVTMANRVYAYTTEHAPLDLNLPLWKLKANRPAEWQGIINALEGSPKEVFTTIISVPEVQSFLDGTYFPSGSCSIILNISNLNFVLLLILTCTIAKFLFHNIRPSRCKGNNAK